MNTQVIHKRFGTKVALAFLTNAFAILLATLTGIASAATISWHADNGNGPLAAANFAGVNLVSNWTVVTATGTASSLKDNSNATTTASIVSSSQYGFWRVSATTPGQDTDTSYNRNMINSYLNSAGATTTAISGIPYAQYSIYVYFSSDTAGRTGTVSDGTTTYTFTAIGPSSVSGGNATLTQTTATSGNPTANYAVFTNETSSSKTITCTVANGGGIAGVQIVDTTPASYLFLSADTTASPSTNLYTGSTVTFSSSFIGTQPITNQWEVNTGSGFVPITGATNTTLTLTNLQLTNSGAYALFASNVAGSSNSTPVTLSVLDLPTNSLGINVQFVGSWLDGNAPTQTGAAVIGTGADVWNTVSNPTGSASVAGTARGTNLVLFDTGNITTPITMDYIGDYVFNGTAFGYSNPFKDAGSPYANLMSGYMGSVTPTGASSGDTNTITLRHLAPGVYDVYCYVCGRSDGQTRVDTIYANDQSAVCGPNNNNYSLISGVNYVHLTPTVTINGVLNISYYGTTDAGQGLLNGFQVNGPDTNVSLTVSSDTTCDSPLNDYVGRNLSFAASFAGFPTPTLQWEVDKGSGFVPITGATNSTLVLTNVQTTDSGSYALFATNAAGSLNSTAQYLNVQPLTSPLSINVQFDGTTYTGTHATPQVGQAAVYNGDFWNPVSNPNPVGGDTNPIAGTGLLLTDGYSYGTPLTLDYTGNQDYNNGANTPFNGSGSPAANLMQASLVTLNSNTGTVTVHGIPAGVYDLYLFSCGSSNAQNVVTHFAANDSYDTCGPNNTNNVLLLETNYVHLTPTVTTNGLLHLSFVGTATGQGNLNGIQLVGPGATPLAPIASFSGTPTNGLAPLQVVFTDASTGSITNWVWSFGDGNSVTNSSNASVTNTYAAAGTYTVTLMVSGAGGSNTNIQTGYIAVSPKPVFGGVKLTGDSLVLSGSNCPAGVQYRILTSTNVALPVASWTPVFTNVFAPDGSYGYTNSPSGNPAGFFRLVTP